MPHKDTGGDAEHQLHALTLIPGIESVCETIKLIQYAGEGNTAVIVRSDNWQCWPGI